MERGFPEDVIPDHVTHLVSPGGAVAGGIAPTGARVYVTAGGAVARGIPPTASVPVPPGGAVAGGIPPIAVVAAAVALEVAGLPDAAQDAIFHTAGGVVELVVHYALPFLDNAGDARIELAVLVFFGLVVGRATNALARTPSVLPRSRTP